MQHPPGGVQAGPSAAAAEFEAMELAHRSGDFGRAKTHRTRLYKLGWICTPRAGAAAGDRGPGTLFGDGRNGA